MIVENYSFHRKTTFGDLAYLMDIYTGMEYYLVGLLASDVQYLEQMRGDRSFSSARPELLVKQAELHIDKLNQLIEGLNKLPPSNEISGRPNPYGQNRA